jgi:hypothetical protein
MSLRTYYELIPSYIPEIGQSFLKFRSIVILTWIDTDLLYFFIFFKNPNHGCQDSHKIIEKVILIRKSTILSSKLTQCTLMTLWFIPEYIIYISQYFSTWEHAMEATWFLVYSSHCGCLVLLLELYFISIIIYNRLIKNLNTNLKMGS